ncbi:RND superfamily putative drug exporter [Streptomyces olivoverticillatus]|uniref:RND superfamily putative drug exporter n=1 Tax=Streptomyces olivoverticillatus TaxID=66427 RepID=A0A7W7LTL9_9ACTN|nr:MMPL family transporter [Streptomyces olivoverticillatus]MBB4895516.1 RND superfamily putative drug exporter [Streptomyces olivoverticillatus]
MATFLYRLARSCYRRRTAVLAIWLALLIGLGGLAAAFSGKTSDEFRVPGTEAQRALDRIADTLPEYANASAQVVFAARKGETLTTPEHRKAVGTAAAAIGRAEGVAGVREPFASQAVSRDGRIALAQVVFDKKLRDLGDGPRDAVRKAGASARDAGLQVEFGGDAYTPTVQVEGGEVIGVGVAVLVLLITFGSLVAAGLPLASAVVGVGVGMAGLLALTGAFDVISTAPVLALMIGMAVGIDYALFIVSRHRQNLAEGMAPEEAAARAGGTAGSAVVFAGATVVVALAGLAVAGVPFLTVMGLSAAGAVVIAMLVAITLLPALLGYAGRSVERLPVPGLRKRAAGAGPGAGERWGRFVVRRPVAVLLACLVAVGAVAIPAKDLRLGLPGGGSYGRSTTARKAYDLVSEGFGQGFNGPLVTVVDASRAERPDRAVQQVAQQLAQLPGVATPLAPSFDKSGKLAAVPVIPEGGPDSRSTADLVSRIRDQRPELRRSGVDIAVSGTTAGNIDVSRKLGDALPPFLAVIVGISLILLALAFRSVLVPLKAIAGFLLSIAAATGAVVAVYQWGWLSDVFPVPRTGPVVSFLPILLIGVLFGLAMDYELFLVSRMKEERAHGAEPRPAVVSGFGNGARVVTAAALIMISVFGSFAFGHDPIVQPIGFALAVGVVIDAFVVRMALVPAVMALLGRAAWWFPGFLERVVPKVDMEGERLAVRQPVQPEGEGVDGSAAPSLVKQRGAGR